MEGVDNENGSATARPEADAAAATKEAAIQVVATMSRRVRGGDKAAGIVAGYARPGADKLHTLRDVDDLRLKSTEAVVQRPGCKLGGLLGLYQQRMPAVVMKGIKGEKPADAAPMALVPGFVTASAKAGFVIHVQKLGKMVTELWAVNEMIAFDKGNLDGDSEQICMEELARLDRGKPDGKLQPTAGGGSRGGCLR